MCERKSEVVRGNRFTQKGPQASGVGNAHLDENVIKRKKGFRVQVHPCVRLDEDLSECPSLLR